MIVKPRRQVTLDMFTDLTLVPLQRVHRVPDGLELEFAEPLADDVAALVRARVESVNDADATIRGDLATALDALTAAKATFDAIKAKANTDIGPKDTKDMAAELSRITRLLRQLVRVSIGRYDGTD